MKNEEIPCIKCRYNKGRNGDYIMCNYFMICGDKKHPSIDKKDKIIGEIEIVPIGLFIEGVCAAQNVNK